MRFLLSGQRGWIGLRGLFGQSDGWVKGIEALMGHLRAAEIGLMMDNRDNAGLDVFACFRYLVGALRVLCDLGSHVPLL
ncbi:hypothetical protein Tco_0138944 [Tanacetum coccineum]